MIGFSIILWFWQSMATPTPQPESASNVSVYVSIIVVAILSFVFGVLVTTVFFIATRRKVENESAVNEFKSEFGGQMAAIKQCPKCNSTYTDEDLKFCLRDGITLKIVGSMPIPHDPDKTTEFRG